LQAVATLDLVVFNKETLQFANLISMAGLFQNFFACKRYGEKNPSRSCGFQQRNALIRKSNQHGWLIPKLRRLQEVGNLDPVVFSQAMLQFEDLLSMAGSFQNFFDLNYSRRSLV
jgi:hypothetical protein